MRDNVIIKQRSNIPLVTVAVAARGGSRNEGKGQVGFTGLLGRMSIKGTANRTAAQIAIAAEGMGGSVSPSVGADLLDWEITVPSRHFERAVELLADVAFNPAFPEREFEVERKLALADLQQSRDDMYRYPLRLCLQQAFKGHPYGNTIAEVESSIAAATRDDIAAWHTRQVRANPWAFVVGDVDAEHAARVIEQYLPSAAAGPSEFTEHARWHGNAVDADTREKAQTALAIGFPGPARNDDDAHVLQVLANAVGGLGGRFFEELRSKRSLAYTVALMPISRWLGGTFVAYIATAPEREEEARTALLEQFDRLRNEPLSADDVARSQRYTIGTWQIRSQTNGAQMGELIHAYMVGPGISEIEEFEQQIMTVTPERILAAAQKYFDPAIAVEGVVRGVGKKA